MMLLTEILSLIKEATSPIDLALYSLAPGSKKWRQFKNEKERDAYREDWIAKEMKRWDLPKKTAEQNFWDEHSTAKEHVELDSDYGIKIKDKYWANNAFQTVAGISAFYKNMEQWKSSSDRTIAKYLLKNKAIFDKGKKVHPDIFKPNVPSGKLVYRGLNEAPPNIKSFIKQSDWKLWKRTDFKAGSGEKDYWYVYSGKFTYTPNKPAQSWTTTPNIIMKHFYESEESVILFKPLDNEFYFSIPFLDWVSGNHFKGENEVVRIGEAANDVKIIAARRTILNYKGHEMINYDVM
jgi:hypothetical protein